MNALLPYRLYFLLSFFFLIIASAAFYTGELLLLAIPFGVMIAWLGYQQLFLLFCILVFTVPFSIEYLVNPQLGTDLPDEPLMLLCSFLFLLSIASGRIRLHQKLYHPLIFFLAIHFAWMILTSIVSTHPLLSFKFLLAKGWYIAAFVLIPVFFIKTKAHVKALAVVFTTAVLIVTLLIFFKHSQFAFTFRDVNEAVYPFFRNHVNYSAIICCCVPILLAAFTLSKNFYSKSLVLILFLFLSIAIYFSYSRGAWIAAVLSLPAMWLASKRLLSYVFLIFVAISFTFAAWLVHEENYMRFAHNYKTTIFHTDFREHLTATYQLEDLSTAERFNRWVAAGHMIKEKPVIGYGPSTFYSEYKPFMVPAFKTWVSANTDKSTVHNYFLLVLVEQGYPGLIIFLALVFMMIRYAEKIIRNSTDRFSMWSAMAISGVIVIVLVVNFLSDLIETDKVGSIFFLSVGILIALRKLK